MNVLQKPLARHDGLVIQEMPDEVLVFDLETNKAHCLNQTAAFVWKACDGNNSVAEITRLFGSQSGKPVEEDLIWLAIDQLSDNNLLAEQIKADFKNQTRREVIKKIGLAAVIALPLVSSLIAPTAAWAVACSASTNTTPCTQGVGGVCCNGVCCQGAINCAGACTSPLAAPVKSTGKTSEAPVKSSGKF